MGVSDNAEGIRRGGSRGRRIIIDAWISEAIEGHVSGIPIFFVTIRLVFFIERLINGFAGCGEGITNQEIFIVVGEGIVLSALIAAKASDPA